MSDLPVYGIDRDIQARQQAKYNPQAEAKVREWIEAITGESIGPVFHEGLKSGVILCHLINKIRPNSVPHINTQLTPFKERENIANFLKACRTLGMHEGDLFGTVDLYENKDIVAVINGLTALGGQAQKIGYSGPRLGLATTQKRHSAFVPGTSNAPSKLTQGNYGFQEKPTGDTSSNINKYSSNVTTSNEVSRLNMGNYGIQQSSGADTSNNINRYNNNVATSNDVSRLNMGNYGIQQSAGADTSNNINRYNSNVATSSDVSRLNMGNYGIQESGGVDTSRNINKYSGNVTASNDVSRLNMGNYGVQQATEAVDNLTVAKAGSKTQWSTEQKDAYGMDAELKARAAAKYDKKLEEEVQHWIEEILNERFPSDFQSSLKDGTRLCRLINAIQPGTVRTINTQAMPFKQMENIANFLKGCRELGMKSTDLFGTVDLYENKDLLAVVQSLRSLGGIAKARGFRGPTIGVAYSAEAKRDPSQFKSDPTAVSKLNQGNYGIQQTTGAEAGRNIDRNQNVNWGGNS